MQKIIDPRHLTGHVTSSYIFVINQLLRKLHPSVLDGQLHLAHKIKTLGVGACKAKPAPWHVFLVGCLAFFK